jgi:uncharacterized membrane protein
MNANSFQPNESTQATQLLPIAMNARRQSIVVRAPTVKVYERWSQFENFPRFITPVREVRKIDDTHFFCTWLCDGKERQCVVHVLLRVPEQRIAWRTISHGFAFGVVSFERTSNQDTEITLKIRCIYDPSTLSRRLEEYLHNFKRLIENSEPTV